MVDTWKSRCCAARLRYFISWLFCTLLCLFVFKVNETRYGNVKEQSAEEEEDTFNHEEDSLRFVRQSTQRVWEKRNFLVIFGFPSLDIPVRRWRRHMQRITCWQFAEVATRHNNYTGAMLVLYLLARHQMHNFVFSNTLVEEAEQWHDIVIHPMNEGKSSTDKILSDNGYWGLEAEIGSSRKTFFWFRFALRQFPRVPYIAKGDDDTFIAVPQYLADLRRLPRKRTYWGRYSFVRVEMNTKGDKGKVRYMLGFCFTLARDAAESFQSYKPIQRLLALPYSNKTEIEFIAMSMQYEDVMIGRLLQEVKFPVIFFSDGHYRLHTNHRLPASEFVVAIHKPEEHEYYKYVNNIMVRKVAFNATRIIKKRKNFYLMRLP